MRRGVGSDRKVLLGLVGPFDIPMPKGLQGEEKMSVSKSEERRATCLFVDCECPPARWIFLCRTTYLRTEQIPNVGRVEIFVSNLGACSGEL